jgi:hypothetical protein
MPLRTIIYNGTNTRAINKRSPVSTRVVTPRALARAGFQ